MASDLLFLTLQEWTNVLIWARKEAEGSSLPSLGVVPKPQRDGTGPRKMMDHKALITEEWTIGEASDLILDLSRPCLSFNLLSALGKWESKAPKIGLLRFNRCRIRVRWSGIWVITAARARKTAFVGLNRQERTSITLICNLLMARRVDADPLRLGAKPTRLK